MLTYLMPAARRRRNLEAEMHKPSGATEHDDAYGMMRRGLELLEEGRPEQAAPLLERARKLEPGKGSILEALGRAYYGTGRYSFAASRFEEALDIDPANDYAHYCLGLCYLKLNRHLEASGHFKITWSLRPQDEYRGMARRSGADV